MSREYIDTWKRIYENKVLKEEKKLDAEISQLKKKYGETSFDETKLLSYMLKEGVSAEKAYQALRRENDN